MLPEHATTDPGPVNAPPGNLAALQHAFLPVSSGGIGVFDEGQAPIIVGQAVYDANYVDTVPSGFPTTWPNWGISRITDYEMSFMNPDGTHCQQLSDGAKGHSGRDGRGF